MKSVAASLEDYFDALVHPSARANPLMAARHRAFIGSRLAGGACALAALPVFLVATGLPGPIEALIFAWLLAPIGIAVMLSRTGDFERAHLLSALTVAGLVGAVGGATGGLESFALPWLLIVPLEAAFSGSRRIVGWAATFAAVAFLFCVASSFGLAPAGTAARLAELKVASFLAALTYCAALGVGATRIVVAGDRKSVV